MVATSAPAPPVAATAAATLAGLTARVPGLTHLTDQALREATQPRAQHGIGESCAEEEPGGGESDGGPSAATVSLDDGRDCDAERVPGWVTDPAAGLARAKAEFDDARAAADAALRAALRRAQDAEATREAHARMLTALQLQVRSRETRLNTRRWALEAYKLRLEAELAQLGLALWYMHVLHQATDGGRYAVSRGEAAVLMRVKDVIETQRCEFGVEQFLHLVESLPRELLGQADTQRGLLLLREEVGLSPDKLRLFMHARGLPVPLALRVGDGTRAGKVRGSTAASTLGVDAPRASMRLSLMGNT